MHFVDECDLRVEAGAGGDGAIAFRREKFVPFGGPAGGDGGRGGSVVFVGDPGMNTLYDFQHTPSIRAERGANGGGKDRYGKSGSDREVRVPLGTMCFERASGQMLFEITKPHERVVVARGGRGGRGNKHFTTSVEQAPRRAESGEPGEERELHLELKVLADVGLLGFPNVGKSTLISVVSRARPKIAEYPFTTLVPQLGVVRPGDAGDAPAFVIADIPGLIPGASRGAGLGIQFLKHVERTRLLLHLVTVTDEPGRDPLRDYEQLREELGHFDSDLSQRPEIVALSKSDLPTVRERYPELRGQFAARGVELHLISAATRDGVDALMRQLARHFERSE